MHEPDPQKASGLFDVEVLGQVQRVVVPVPGEDAALAEVGRQFERGVMGDADRERGAALVEVRRIVDAINLQTGNLAQARHHAGQ